MLTEIRVLSRTDLRALVRSGDYVDVAAGPHGSASSTR
jgi:hypothetical protein